MSTSLKEFWLIETDGQISVFEDLESALDEMKFLRTELKTDFKVYHTREVPGESVQKLKRD